MQSGSDAIARSSVSLQSKNKRTFQLNTNGPHTDSLCIIVNKVEHVHVGRKGGGALYSEVQIVYVLNMSGDALVDRKTDRTENIALPRLRWRSVIRNYSYIWDTKCWPFPSCLVVLF